jgi:hypothetical protein
MVGSRSAIIAEVKLHGWYNVWPGAVASAVLFNGGKLLISGNVGTHGLETQRRSSADLGLLCTDCVVW